MRNQNNSPVENPHSDYHYIYLIRNTRTGRIYVGNTKNPEQRFAIHLYNLTHNRHSAKLMQKDYNEGSSEEFVLEVLEKAICPFEAAEIERLYMVIYRTFDDRYGYNSQDGRFYSQQAKKTTKFHDLIMSEAWRYSDAKKGQ